MKSLAIIGGGGHGKVTADIAQQLGWNVCFFDAAFPQIRHCGKWPVLGSDDDLDCLAKDYDAVFIAIGNNNTRFEKQRHFKSKGFKVATLISPNAIVSEEASIGEGTLVVCNACVNCDTRIGDGVIINTGANIDHDCHIEDFAHVSPGVNMAGEVRVGERTWIGIGSTVIQQVSIASNAVIGAGAVVLSNIPANVTAVGCPAKLIQKR